MIVIELVLYAITYTVLIIALFLEVICYKRNMEAKESIAFTLSLLLLVISISVSPLFGTTQLESYSTISTLVCMTLVASTTLLNILQERKHSVPLIFIRLHIAIACTLLLAIVVSYFTDYILYTQWVVVFFLIASIVLSMIIVMRTKPQKKYVHLEKSNRLFSIVFITLIPLYLLFQYGFEQEYDKLRIGLIVPITFILLALHKIYDDLQRLSLIKIEKEPKYQHFINYDLTLREKEIATLLSNGSSYQTISEKLFISIPTVKTHCSNIYKKCGVKSRHELTILLNS